MAATARGEKMGRAVTEGHSTTRLAGGLAPAVVGYRAMTDTLLPRGESYADVYARFRWPIPTAYNIAVDVCDRHASDRSRVALVYEDDAGRVSEHTFAEFRARSNLTLSYGFRWSLFRQPTDGHGHANTFDPEAFNPAEAPAIDISTGLMVPGSSTPVVNGLVNRKTSRFGNSLYRQNNWNIAPRIGLAWDPFHQGTTAIRAGYGIFFDNTSKSAQETAIFYNAPLVRNVNINNTNLGDPGSVVSDTDLIPGGAGGVGLYSMIPYAEQWSLDVQQRISSSTLIGIGYYGNRNVHLPGGMDINQPHPGDYLAAGVLPNGPIFQNSTQLLNYVRPYPGFSSINLQENRFRANYNSLQVQLQTHIRNDSFVTVNYTFSHALDNLSSTFSDGNDLRQRTGLPLLGVVTLLMTDVDRQRERASLFRFAGASGGLVVLSVAGLVALFVMNRYAGA